ncbi:MAG: type II secretion system protein [Planctomycetota bacterium]|nr:type II secretion system protein [Planctomycetota bacterium]
MFTHQTAKHQTTKQRPAYSLVELLVVIGIILGVMGMVMAIYPSYNQREEMYKSADIVRNSLMRARQWAIRDKAITGIEFNTLPGNLGVSLTFVQSPVLIYGSVTNLKIEAVSTATPPTTPDLYLTKYDQGTGNWIVPTFTPAIASGDYIISDKASLIGGPNGMAPIEPYTEGTPTKLRLPLSNSILLNGQSFKILRKPTAIPNEPVLKFDRSPGIVVDLSMASTGGSRTVLFNANGQSIPKNVGILTIKVVQTDPGTPYIKPAPDAANSNVVLTLVESAALANVAINETYINLEAATGVTKVIGKAGAN